MRAGVWVLVGSWALGATASHAGAPPPGVTPTQGSASPGGVPCVNRGLPTVLAQQQLGDAIQDGVGYGGVRLGAPVSELVRRWGAGACKVSVPEPTYWYVASRDGQRAAELIGVRTKQGRVFTLVFTLLPHGGGVPPSLTTSLGIKLAATPAAVRQAYGKPDAETARTAIYTSRGIGFFGYFNQLDPFVLAIFVFPPGTDPAALDLAFN